MKTQLLFAVQWRGK